MPEQSALPDILVLMSDQHSRHVLGSYGDTVVRTPNLDRLAGEGMRFPNAYCASPVCCASRMSFMTGRKPGRIRVWNNQHILNSGIPTWAHVLGLAGYETSLLGRMHFEGPDQYHGFENRPIGEFFAIHPGARDTSLEKYPSGQSRKVMEKSGYGTTTYQYMDDRIGEATCRYLRERAKRRGRRPFAAVVGFVLPHCPFVAPKELFDYYYEQVDVPKAEGDHPPMIRQYRRSRGLDNPPLPDERVRIARAAYYGLCEYFDRIVGRVLECLEECGLADNTLVVYCSDHGELAGEHGCWTKNTYYEGSAGVPLVARLPGRILAGAVSNAVCNLYDLGPTFAEVAGAEEIPDWDGHSLWPILRGEEGAEWNQETFSEITDESIMPQSASRMIRRGDWKLWAHLDEEGHLPVSLFHLKEDPGELNDLGGHPDCVERREQLLRELLADWNPREVMAASMKKRKDYVFLRAWGAKLQPQLPETMPSPPPNLEDDVVIL